MADFDNINTTSSTGVSPTMKTFYERKLLERLTPNTPFVKHGQKKPIPKGNGKTIEFRKFNGFEPATTPLTEGVTPAGTKITMTTLTATVKQYGDWVSVTDVLKTTAYDSIIGETVEAQGEQAAETTDEITRDVLLNTTSIYNIGGGLGVNDIVAANKLTADEVLKVRTILKRNNIKPFDNKYYLWFCSPEQAADLMRDKLWQDASVYGNGKNLEEGEIGRIYGFKFIDTTLIEPTSNAGGVDVHSGIAVGKNAYGIVDIENGVKPEVLIKIPKNDDGNTSDPLNQRSTIGWKVHFTAVRLNDLAIIRVNSAATSAS